MMQLDQNQIEDLQGILSVVDKLTVPEQLEYFEYLMQARPMKVDARSPHCSVEYIGITGKGASLNIAATNWIANARDHLAQIDADCAA